MPPPITVVVASANRKLLTVVKAGFDRARTINLTSSARDGRQVGALILRQRPALLILDLALPPQGGLSLIARLRQQSMKTRVLTIDDAFDERRAVQVARAGGTGYMVAEAVPAHLTKAVQCMVVGESWFPRKVEEKIVSEFQRHGFLQAPTHRDTQDIDRGRSPEMASLIRRSLE